MNIPVGLHYISIIDDEDHHLVAGKTWSIAKGYAINRTYPRGKYGPVKTVSMHRLILNAPRTMEVDHINGNTLDNRKANLRLATRQENMRNRRRSATNHSSQYKGVVWIPERKKWRVVIKPTREKAELIGYFEDEHTAALAYDLWAIDVFGEFAYSNFTPLIKG